ncbi:MAG: D-alanyl-D-alanine carboxypeptidase [Bacteroidaceae bacterium]|nr:D-alanyl-D-alanine carboxypeptidase [Bacteroidaceae bacterium]
MKRASHLLLASILVFLTVAGCKPDGGNSQDTEKREQTDSLAAEVHLQHVPDTITLAAKYAVLMDMNTGDILYGKNMDARTSPASLTKMMTCILAVEHGDMTEQMTLGDTCLKNSYYFENEQTWTLRRALQEMMMLSDNGTAYMIANHFSSPDTSFIDMMNIKAKQIGLKNTHFMNPVGFYDPEHYTSARDMANLARYCMKDNWFRIIVATKYDNIRIEKKNSFIDTCKNTNDLLHDYEGCIGIKTGYIQKAGYCIVVAASRGDRTLIAVVMQTPDRETRNADARRLLDEGFKLQELKPGEKLPDAKNVVTPIDTTDSTKSPEPPQEKPEVVAPVAKSEKEDSIDLGKTLVKSKVPRKNRYHRHRYHRRHRR